MIKTKNRNLKYYYEKKVLNPPFHVKDELELLFSFLPKSKKVKITDFGSGGGRLTIPLLRRGFKVLAIDIDNEARKRIKNLAKKLKLDKNLKITCRFKKNEKFNYIIGSDILHHINIKEYLFIFKKHLEKGGKIIFSEPNPLNLSWIFFISLFCDWRQEKGIFACNYFNLKNQLELTGFKNINIKSFALIPPQIFYFLKLGFLNKINFYLASFPFLKLFSYRYIIYAEKD